MEQSSHSFFFTLQQGPSTSQHHQQQQQHHQYHCFSPPFLRQYYFFSFFHSQLLNPRFSYIRFIFFLYFFFCLKFNCFLAWLMRMKSGFCYLWRGMGEGVNFVVSKWLTCWVKGIEKDEVFEVLYAEKLMNQNGNWIDLHLIGALVNAKGENRQDPFWLSLY